MDTSLKRIVAYIIDIAIVTIIVTLISNIKVINPYLEDYNKNYEVYNELIEKNKNKEIEKDAFEEEIIEVNYQLGQTNVINGTITIVALVLYFGIAQMLMEGQTVGKRIMKVRLVSKNNNKKLHIGNYLIRTVILNNIIFRILLIVGVYVFSKGIYYNFATVLSLAESIVESIILIMVVLKSDNRGLHDILAGTKVIDLNPVEVETPKAKEVIEVKEVKEKKPASKKENTNKAKKSVS